MKIGTKSVLFGAHCFFLHPFFLAAAWWKLYGFPWDPRLWVAFFVHDLGYWGKPNMDGAEGELHPYLGARVMQVLFDREERKWKEYDILNVPIRPNIEILSDIVILKSGHLLDVKKWRPIHTRWYDFTLYHSRFLAKKEGAQFSRLCVADKLAIALVPAWLYLPLVNLTGEIKEYMRDAARNSNGDIPVQNSQIVWYNGVRAYCRAWVAEHKEGKDDQWTTAKREASEIGVWQ